MATLIAIVAEIPLDSLCNATRGRRPVPSLHVKSLQKTSPNDLEQPSGWLLLTADSTFFTSIGRQIISDPSAHQLLLLFDTAAAAIFVTCQFSVHLRSLHCSEDRAAQKDR